MNKRNKHKLTSMQLVMLALFSLIDKLSSKVAGYFLFTLWLMPGIKKKKHDRALPESSEQYWLRVREKRIAYWLCGTGPTVLFVHGWGSYGAQFSMLINAFYSAGYRVIWFDAPAHGLSSGWQTNIFEIHECISSLQAKYGHFDIVIGHSFGALSSMRAVSEGLSVSKLVTLSSPSNAIGLMDKFCFFFNPSEKSKLEMKGRIEKKYGDDLWDVTSVKTMAKKIRQSVLIIHDKDDRMISCKEGIANKRKLDKAELVLTEHLGHNRIVQNEDVANKILDFAHGRNTKTNLGLNNQQAG